MVKCTDILEDFAATYTNAADETSAIITILLWCCTQTQSILPRCTTSMRSLWVQTESDQQVSEFPVIAQEPQGVYTLQISSLYCARLSVMGSP
jgi:hypothetical protein